MRGLNKILNFSPEKRLIKVQAGIRWCDIQKFIDPHDLSIQIMQTYANFTVGGALSVNAHGRYMGLGPLVLSVKSLDIILPDGRISNASPTLNPDLFYGAVGGYNCLGLILNVELFLTDNIKVKRQNEKVAMHGFVDYFDKKIRNNEKIVFYNADIYPPHYININSVFWAETEEEPTTPKKLMGLKNDYPIERYFLWAFTETPLGKWRRQYIIEPLLYLRKRVHWRNYEAGYDVAELEPRNRLKSTYVLLEYFVPVEKLKAFTLCMADIFRRYEVNVVNVSIRHSIQDPGTFLAWATTECFALVVYYKQKTSQAEKQLVGIWTRELIDAAISVGGTYYLPYQIHATYEQFVAAYPKAPKLFKLKKEIDPTGKFKNNLWNKYYNHLKVEMNISDPEFVNILNSTTWSDNLFKFLQNVFHLYPPNKFHFLISQESKKGGSDAEIYERVRLKLRSIKPFLSDIRYSLPALVKQKRVITNQFLKLLRGRKQINGYLEIGSTGRYISHHLKKLNYVNNIYLTNDRSPDYSLSDIFERGKIKTIGNFFPLKDYSPISNSCLGDESIEVITCYIGLHHCPNEKLDAYIKSLYRILKPGGIFIIREHDVTTPEMRIFASLVHTVFNLGTDETWEYNKNEYRKFMSVDEWASLFHKHGFKKTSEGILQDLDPSLNTLISFIKE